MDGHSSAFSAQEREIETLRQENRILRRDLFEAQSRLDPCQRMLEQLSHHLTDRDRLMESLAKGIRQAIETYERKLELLRDEKLSGLSSTRYA